MTNDAQDALQAFLNTWTNGSDYAALSDQEKIAVMVQKTELELAAQREIKANLAENRLNIVAELQSKGFNADNSIHDWNKLVAQHPEWFGPRASQLAIEYCSISSGVEYFYNFIQPYLKLL